MARDFDGTTGSLRLATAVAGMPLTMACWFNTTATESTTLIDIGEVATTNKHLTLQIRSGGEVAARGQSGGSRRALTTTNYSTNTWHHAVARFVSSTSRFAYIDGGSEGTNTQSANPTANDGTNIGVTVQTTPGEFFSGRIAEIGIWDVDLSVSEILMLAKGWSPLRVRPTAIQAYWPLYAVGTDSAVERNYAGDPTVDHTMVPNGATLPTLGDHSPMRSGFGFTRPTHSVIAGAAAAPDPGFLAAHYRRRVHSGIITR